MPRRSHKQRSFPFADPMYGTLVKVFERENAAAAARAAQPYNEFGRDIGIKRAVGASTPGFVDAAMAMALEIEARDGVVTSPAVLVALRLAGWEPTRSDKQAMGKVFTGKRWERVGWLTGPDSPGSHARPVAQWKLRKG